VVARLQFSESQEWRVIPADEADGPITFEAKHAPKGGVSISGRQYKGGMFIPLGEYAKADEATKAAIDAPKKARQDARRARGPVDAQALRERLASHSHDLTPAELRSAKSAFHALRSHHGDLTLHRLEELTGDLEKAKAQASTEGEAEHFGRRLAALRGMIDLAHEHGITGGDAAQPHTLSQADFLKRVKIDGKDVSLDGKKLATFARPATAAHAARLHRNLVEAALDRGEDVPEEALQGYPDLQKRVADSPTTPAEKKAAKQAEAGRGDSSQRVGKDGTVYVRAPKGGATSDVTGEFYHGGQWMPIHGLSPKKEPGEGQGVPSAPAKANEDKEKPGARQPRGPMSPEDIEAEKQKRADQAAWDEMRAGPLGKLKGWMGEHPNGKAMSTSGIVLKDWHDFAEQIGPEGVKKIIAALEPTVHGQIDKGAAEARKNPKSGFAPVADDIEEWSKGQIKKSAEEDATQGRNTKAHEKAVPGSHYARQLVQAALDNDGKPSIESMQAVAAVLKGAAESKAEPLPPEEAAAAPPTQEDQGPRPLQAILKDTRAGEKKLGQLYLDGKGDSDEAKQVEQRLASLKDEQRASQHRGTPKAPKPKPATDYKGSDGREPWQLTAKEWGKAKDEAATPNHMSVSPSEHARLVAETDRLHFGVKNPYDPDLGRSLPVSHKDVVAAAVAAGKPVPAEVLADYPDLKAPTPSHQQTPEAFRAKSSLPAHLADELHGQQVREAWAKGHDIPAHNQHHLAGAVATDGPRAGQKGPPAPKPLSPGDTATYTGKAGALPVEFRGWHDHAQTGERMARVIVRPAVGSPFETSVRAGEVGR
jgi:hypothetical protein